MMIFWFNGRFCDQQEIHLFDDRGYLLGDGVFTTFRNIHGKVFCLKEHIKRLQSNAHFFHFNICVKTIETGIQAMCQKNPNSTIRVTLSRKAKNRGLHIQGDEITNTLITSVPYITPPKIIRMALSHLRIFSGDPLAHIKHAGYQIPLLARYEAEKKGMNDALLINEKNQVCCATAANFFYIMHNKIYTPPLSSGCLPGITRSAILNAKKASVRPLNIEEIGHLNAAFLTNSLGVQIIEYIEGNISSAILNVKHPSLKNIAPYDTSL